MVTNSLSPAPLASAGTHKRVQWRKPPGKRPGVIDATRKELVRCLEQRMGSVWLRIKNRVAVSGYTIERSNDRVRALRSDGAESLLALAVALLYMTDVRSGFIGKPRAEGGPWHRYTLRDIAQLAYGSQTDADLRRASRAIAAMVSLGWAWPTKQVRRPTDAGEFRSEPGVRRLNLNRICSMVGTTWLLKRDRAHADQKYGTNTASIEEARAAKKATDERRQQRRQDKDRLEAGLRDGWPPAAPPGPSRAAGTASGPTLLRDLFK